MGWLSSTLLSPWGERRKSVQLLGRLGLAGLLAVGPVVLFLELLDTSGRVHELHFAREERVTGRADFDVDCLARAARGEFVAATAGHGCLNVFRMNAVFHGLTPPRPDGRRTFPHFIGRHGSHAREPGASRTRAEPPALWRGDREGIMDRVHGTGSIRLDHGNPHE